MHHQLMLKAAARGKYAQLFRHLSALDVSRWRATFSDIESILGFTLPDSARIHRPWWSNQSNGGHSHALAWQAAGWRTSAVDLHAETLVFERMQGAPQSRGRPAPLIEEIFPPHDFGNWPDGFTASRDQVYGDRGR